MSEEQKRRMQATLLDVDFSGPAPTVTLRLWDDDATFRAGTYFLIEADEEEADQGDGVMP